MGNWERERVRMVVRGGRGTSFVDALLLLHTRSWSTTINNETGPVWTCGQKTKI